MTNAPGVAPYIHLSRPPVHSPSGPVLTESLLLITGPCTTLDYLEKKDKGQCGLLLQPPFSPYPILFPPLLIMCPFNPGKTVSLHLWCLTIVSYVTFPLPWHSRPMGSWVSWGWRLIVVVWLVSLLAFLCFLLLDAQDPCPGRLKGFISVGQWISHYPSYRCSAKRLVPYPACFVLTIGQRQFGKDNVHQR